MTAPLQQYVLRLGDNALIMAQRMIEQVTHSPELEEELANANFALDYVGQARLFYQYAAELDKDERDEDYFAYQRDAQEFQNLVLLEQPLTHFGDRIVRQVLFESWYLSLLELLAQCNDTRLAEIAVRAEKEIQYHLRHARLWLVRLGDGTDESHAKMQQSLDDAWRYCGELFASDEIDDEVNAAIGVKGGEELSAAWQSEIAQLLAEATLETPKVPWAEKGGRQGYHSEHLGYLVAEMQSLARAHPGAVW